jgi:deoxycytidine triphosphate deaminase
MSLINIKNRVTSDEKIFDSNSFSDQSFLFLKDSNNHVIESFSLELTLGNGWADRYSDKERSLIEIDDENGIEIAKKGSVVVEVGEDINMPHNLYGIIVPTGSLFLSKGILIAPSKIEPSFNGKMKLRLFNTSNDKFILKKKDKLASAIFFSTDVTEHQPEIKKGSDIAKRNLNGIQTSLRWIKNYPAVFAAYVTPTITILILLITYLSFYKPTLDNQSKLIEASKKEAMNSQEETKKLRSRLEELEKQIVKEKKGS